MPEAIDEPATTSALGITVHRALDTRRAAAEIALRSPERLWDSELVARYAGCKLPEVTKQLEVVERWLPAHGRDASPLYALGRLCERAQLWGKARAYYEAANANLAAALRLAIAELEGRSR